jgi:O-antigen/teichoic acid export membrane protein
MASNLSFQLITLSATTIVSIFYTTEQMGYFSLSVTISNAIKLITGSAMFVIYPKLLNKLARNDNTLKREILDKFHKIYVFSADFITILVFSIIPVFDLYFTKYQPINNNLKILIVSQLILNSSIGFSTLLIAEKEERKMTKFGFISIIFVLITCLSIHSFKGSFNSISFSVFLGMTIYTMLILIQGLKKLKESVSLKKMIILFSPNKLIFIIIIIMSLIIHDNLYSPILAIILFILFSINKIINLLKLIPSLILDNNLIKF